MIKFHCPHCDQKISTEEESTGAATQCPECGGEIVVPAASDEAPNEEVAPEVHEGNNPAENAEAATDGSSQPDKAGGGHSFKERIKSGTKEGWAGIKRHSKQAALIAQAEKLRTVDLRKALHSLGKKCFETGELADALAEQFQAIRDLDASIAEKREKGEAVADETRMATLKRIGKDAAKASHAQALVLKREHLVTELGGQAYTRGMERGTEALRAEFQAIADIESLIQRKEEEARMLGDGGKSRMPTLAVAAGLALLLVAGAFFGMRMLGSVGVSPGLTASSETQERKKDQEATSDNTAESVKPIQSPRTSRDSFVVKGFWVGMSEKDAKERLREIFGKDLSFRKKEGLFQGNLEVFFFESDQLTKLSNYAYYGESASCLINIDVKSRQLHSLSVAGHHFDKFFDSRNISIEDFMKQFMVNYGISRMHPDPRVNDFDFPFLSFYVDIGQVKVRLISKPDNLNYKEFSLDYIPKASF